MRNSKTELVLNPHYHLENLLRLELPSKYSALAQKNRPGKNYLPMCTNKTETSLGDTPLIREA